MQLQDPKEKPDCDELLDDIGEKLLAIHTIDEKINQEGTNINSFMIPSPQTIVKKMHDLSLLDVLKTAHSNEATILAHEYAGKCKSHINTIEKEECSAIRQKLGKHFVLEHLTFFDEKGRRNQINPAEKVFLAKNTEVERQLYEDFKDKCKLELDETRKSNTIVLGIPDIEALVEGRAVESSRYLGEILEKENKNDDAEMEEIAKFFESAFGKNPPMKRGRKPKKSSTKESKTLKETESYPDDENLE